MTEAVIALVAVLATAVLLLAAWRMRRPRTAPQRPGPADDARPARSDDARPGPADDARPARSDDAAVPPADHLDPAPDALVTEGPSSDRTADDTSSDEGSAGGLSFPGAMSEDDGERLEPGPPGLGVTSVVPHATERDRAGVNGIGPALGDLLAADQKGTPLSLDATIQQLLTIEGATGAAVIDSESGMALAQGGSPGFDLGIAAAGNSNVVRAKLATMTEIGLDQKINDILITLDKQYHLINVLDTPVTKGLFIYLVLDRTRANLALARHRLAAVAPTVEV
ncbi:MAG: hypothetical protein ACRCYR_00085 [Phycicoccus sp.]